MDDPQSHGSIDKMVAEEHELWERESAGNATDADRQRLDAAVTEPWIERTGGQVT